MSGLPLLVEASGLRALVVGGGGVATRKARTLAEAGAVVRVIALRVLPDMLTLTAAYGMHVAERAYRSGDVSDAQLVVAATDDRAVNAAVAADAHAAHRLVNVADAPEEGAFMTMATHRRGNLVIAVSASGVPGAASRVRDAIGERFDGRYEHALELLGTLRRELLGARRGDEWRRIGADVIDEAFCTSVENGTLPTRLDACR